jgi:DNA (cytosine-5)-methyltransferase 1
MFGDSTHLIHGDILKNVDKIPTNADLLLAGAPCQSWSMAGERKGFEDDRGSLLLKTVEIVRDKNPRFFIWENVEGLLSHDDGRSMDHVLSQVQDAGYHTQFSLLNFSEYGVSQRRKRVIIWGKRHDEVLDLSSLMPRKSHKRALTLGTLLRNHVNAIKVSPCHVIYDGGKLYREFAQILLPGENLAKLSPSTIATRFTAKGLPTPVKRPGGFRPVYRLSPYEVAPTMVFNAGSNVPWHPWENRCISVAEAALVQGFPIEFEFKGSLREQYKQIANAVPPIISILLADAFVSALSAQNAVKE